MAKFDRVFFKLLWVWMATSSFVLVEPAPYDIMFLLILGIATVCSYFIISRDTLIPVMAAGVFVNASVVSFCIVSSDHYASIRFLLITIYLVGSWFLLVCILQKFKKSIFPELFSGYLFAAIVSTVIGILAFFQVLPHAERFILYDEVAGLFKDPNVYGPFLIPPILYSIKKFEGRAGSGQWVWLVLILLFSGGVLLSFSRAAWGNYFISLFVYLILGLNKSYKIKQLKLTSVFIGLLVVAFVLSQFSEAGDILPQKLGYQNYDNDRFGTQLESLKIAVSSPFGIGPYQTEQILDYSTHSLYIRVLTENGFLAALSLALLIISTIYQSLKHILTENPCPYLRIVSASLLGILFNSIFIDSLHWRHFWFLLALPWVPLERGEEVEDSSNSY